MPIGPDQAGGAVGAISSMVLKSLGDVIQRRSRKTQATPMYDRKTPPPMIWIHLRKADPILVNNEFYNISNVPDDLVLNGNITDIKIGTVPKKEKAPEVQQMIPMGSFVEQKHKKVDPVMIANGLFLTQPLRQPPQETINVAAVEDTKTIQGFADYMRKKREIRKLDQAFHKLIRELNQP